MSEIRLQSDMARKFSELYPKKKGQLFHISNERSNQTKAFQAASIGIINGVSDFIYFDLFHPKENGSKSTLVLGLEVKEPNGGYHDKDHVRSQLKWGKTLEKNGGIYRIVRTVEELISCTEGNYTGLTIEEVEVMLDSNKNKTIKF